LALVAFLEYQGGGSANAQTRSKLTKAENTKLRNDVASGHFDSVVRFGAHWVTASRTHDSDDDYIVSFALTRADALLNRSLSTKWSYLTLSETSPNPQRTKAVLDWCTELIRAYPTSAYSHLFAGFAQRSSPVSDTGLSYEATYDRTISHFEKAIEYDPNLGEAYFWLGNVYETKGAVLAGSQASESSYDKAIECFKKAASLNAYNGRSYIELGMLYRAEKHYSEAIASFEDAIKYNPSDDYPYLELGAIYLAVGKIDDSIRNTTIAIRMKPEKGSSLYYNLGAAYEQQGDYKQAIEAYKKFLAGRSDGDVERKVRQRITELQTK
jgi:tetratricopeptide (TPR) repeat protein